MSKIKVSEKSRNYNKLLKNKAPRQSKNTKKISKKKVPRNSRTYQYEHSVRLFMNEKYYIFTADLYHPVKLFDEKFYKNYYKNEIPCQAVCKRI